MNHNYHITLENKYLTKEKNFIYTRPAMPSFQAQQPMMLVYLSLHCPVGRRRWLLVHAQFHQTQRLTDWQKLEFRATCRWTGGHHACYYIHLGIPNAISLFFFIMITIFVYIIIVIIQLFNAQTTKGSGG